LDPKTKSAHKAVFDAVKRGILHRPEVCELCGCNIAQYGELRRSFGLNVNPKLHGHHWRGYEYPLDVWWVCPTCNHALTGRHDGSLSKDQALQMVKPFDLEEKRKWFEQLAIWIAFRSPDHIRKAFVATAEIGRQLVATGRANQDRGCEEFLQRMLED
jgi:hypothetical protein